jgi:hypothetical protein
VASNVKIRKKLVFTTELRKEVIEFEQKNNRQRKEKVIALAMPLGLRRRKKTDIFAT